MNRYKGSKPMNQLDDNGNNLQWTVTPPPRPWWHRGAATAAMLLLANCIIAAWRDEWIVLGVSLALAFVLAVMDSALNKQ